MGESGLEIACNTVVFATEFFTFVTRDFFSVTRLLLDFTKINEEIRILIVFCLTCYETLKTCGQYPAKLTFNVTYKIRSISGFFTNM